LSRPNEPPCCRRAVGAGEGAKWTNAVFKDGEMLFQRHGLVWLAQGVRRIFLNTAVLFG